MKNYLTVNELANVMRVKRRTVLGWVKRKRIPVIQASAKVLRFDPDAVVQALTVPSEVPSDQHGNSAPDSETAATPHDVAERPQEHRKDGKYGNEAERA